MFTIMIALRWQPTIYLLTDGDFLLQVLFSVSFYQLQSLFNFYYTTKLNLGMMFNMFLQKYQTTNYDKIYLNLQSIFSTLL